MALSVNYVLALPTRKAPPVPAVQRALEEAALRRASQLAEQRVTRLTGVLQMLSGINAALIRIQNRDEVMTETCRLAHRVGGYAIVMAALINPTTRMLARPVGWVGYEFLPEPGREFPVADHEAADSSLMGRVIRTGEAVLCEEHRTKSPYVIDGRDAMIGAGVHCLAVLPLRVDNTPVGAFLFGTRATAVIGQEEMLAARRSRLQPVVCAAVSGQAGRCALPVVFRAADGSRQARAVLRAPGAGC